MTKPFQWSQERLARALLLNKTEVLETIAVDLGCSTETIRIKLHALNVPLFVRPKHSSRNVSRIREPREQYKGTYEDMPAEVLAKERRGRVPQPTSHYSQIGCSAAMCLAG